MLHPAPAPPDEVIRPRTACCYLILSPGQFPRRRHSIGRMKHRLPCHPRPASLSAPREVPTS